MVEAYGKPRKYSCSICGRKNLNPSEMHHIIGQFFINERATKRDLLHLSKGLKTPVPKKLEDLRKELINKLPGNVIELCRRCHGMTDSHLVWKDNWEARKSGTKPRAPKRTGAEWAKRGKDIARYKRKRGKTETCKGIAKSTGNRCNHTKKPHWPGDYCPDHLDQDKSGAIDTNEPPGLHDEGRLTEEQEWCLEDWQLYGVPFDKSVFEDKSEAWRKEWLKRG